MEVLATSVLSVEVGIPVRPASAHPAHPSDSEAFCLGGFL